MRESVRDGGAKERKGKEGRRDREMVQTCVSCEPHMQSSGVWL